MVETILKCTFCFCRTRVTVCGFLRLQLHGAIHCADSFVLILRYCANFKAIRYKSVSINRIVADKLHHVIAASQ